VIKKGKEKTRMDYEKFFRQFRANIKSEKVKSYLSSRNLDHKQIEIGYNATSWTSLKHCLIFPLRKEAGEIVSFYGRSIYDKEGSKHFYQKNRSGLYPGYPKRSTKKLLLTEAIIDASTLLQLDLDCEILSLYGTNGLTEEHQKCIRNLNDLEEIVLFFDGDEAGRKAIEKWTAVLRDLQKKIVISYVETPKGEDVNSLSQSHEKEIFKHLLEERKTITNASTLLFSTENEKSIERKKGTNGRFIKEQSPFDGSQKKNLHYRGKAAEYYVKGGIRNGMDSMKISLQIINEQGEDYRSKLDLYEYKQVSAVAKIAAEKLEINEAQIEKDLRKLTGYLEEYRAEEAIEKEEIAIEVPVEISLQCIEFLKRKNLLQEINKLIGRAGIIGEEESRIFLFVIASSYKMEDTLHALVQGSSGSGKTHLITKLASMMPEEDTIGLTRITDSSLYNYGEYELQNKLIILEDLDGLKEDAFLAFRELQSRGLLSSSTSVKDDNGNIRSQIRTVRGPITTLSATTKGEIYEDNMSRSFLIAVNESSEQTQRIISYQNQIATGKINKREQKKIRIFLQHCMRLIHPMEVINPYADKIKLPPEAHKIRRLNELFQSFVRQVTLINQYRRKKDKQGRLLTAKKDIEVACGIMFESIVLKVDELDGSLRQFYEALKKYVKEEKQEFGLREIRQELRMSKTQLHRYIQDLISLEYIQQTGGSANRGYRYTISYWDNIERLRNQIQTNLQEQISRL
jgi:predicted transcriptional regulator/5S rRNA maturation endonuclease (ribonuclease M5)